MDHLISDNFSPEDCYKTDNGLNLFLISIYDARRFELNIRSKALTGNSTEDERQDTIEALNQIILHTS